MTESQSPRYATPPVRETDPAAVVALAAALLFPPVGLVLGLLARRRIRDSGTGGDGLAVAAVVVGAVLTVLYALLIAAGVVLFLLAADASPGDLSPPVPIPAPS